MDVRGEAKSLEAMKPKFGDVLEHWIKLQMDIISVCVRFWASQGGSPGSVSTVHVGEACFFFT